jgi:hypothetical protein
MISIASRDKDLDAYRKSYTKPFHLGRILSTPGVRRVCSPDDLMAYLSSHAKGNWGCVSLALWQKNDRALTTYGEIVSAFPIDDKPCRGKNKIWVVTTADRRTTTLFLPAEARILGCKVRDFYPIHNALFFVLRQIRRIRRALNAVGDL